MVARYFHNRFCDTEFVGTFENYFSVAYNLRYITIAVGFTIIIIVMMIMIDND